MPAALHSVGEIAWHRWDYQIPGTLVLVFNREAVCGLVPAAAVVRVLLPGAHDTATKVATGTTDCCTATPGRFVGILYLRLGRVTGNCESTLVRRKFIKSFSPRKKKTLTNRFTCIGTTTDCCTETSGQLSVFSIWGSDECTAVMGNCEFTMSGAKRSPCSLPEKLNILTNRSFCFKLQPKSQTTKTIRNF